MFYICHYYLRMHHYLRVQYYNFEQWVRYLALLFNVTIIR